MSTATVFFDSSAQGKSILQESGYYHISDIIKIAEEVRKNPALKHMSEEEREEAIINIVLEEKWKVKS